MNTERDAAIAKCVKAKLANEGLSAGGIVKAIRSCQLAYCDKIAIQQLLKPRKMITYHSIMREILRAHCHCCDAAIDLDLA